MAEIILLANSRKLSHRCIAGIDIATGRWIRPIFKFGKAIPLTIINIDGKEPALLDIIQIPLSSAASDDESQPENRLIETGKWTKVGKAKPEEVRKYLEKRGPLFYNISDRVLWDEILKISQKDRKSLMLIECSDLEVYKTTSYRGNPQAKAKFSFDGVNYNLVVTDSCVEQSIFKGELISRKCLLTISLAGKKPNTQECYKLVAGVIEL